MSSIVDSHAAQTKAPYILVTHPDSLERQNHDSAADDWLHETHSIKKIEHPNAK